MDPLVGAAIAAVAAVLSIAGAVLVPAKRLPVQRLRRVGAVSLALVGLGLLGVPIPTIAPLGVLLGGAALALAVPRRAPREAQTTS